MRFVLRFSRDRRGAAAVEFAIIGTVLIFTILFTLLVALVLYISQALDFATVKTARQILIGATQSQVPSATPATFTQNLCRNLPTSILCSNIVVNLYKVPKAQQPAGYYTFIKPDMSGLTIPDLTPGSGSFDLGSRGDYQYLQVIYPVTFLPTVFASMLSGGATFNGKPAYLVVSTMAFRVEQY